MTATAPRTAPVDAASEALPAGTEDHLIRYGSVASLDHLYSGMLSRPMLDVAERLAGTLPAPLSRTMLLTTGAESNEAAIKMAKLATRRYEVVAFDRSWHGMTTGAASLTYSPGRRGYGPAMPGSLTLPTPDAYRSPFRHADGSYDWRTEPEYGFAQIDRASSDSLAACLVEPKLSSGGIIEMPAGDVHGRGLLQGLELVTDKASRTPADALGAAVTTECLRRGLHMNIVQLPGKGGVLRIGPPLTITEDQMVEGLDLLEDSLEEVLTGAH